MFAAEAMVSIRRIEEFLLKDEKNENDLGLERRSSNVTIDTKRRFIQNIKQRLPINGHFDITHYMTCSLKYRLRFDEVILQNIRPFISQ